MQERHTRYKEAPALITEFRDSLSRLVDILNDISSILNADPEAKPPTSQNYFVGTLITAKDSLLKDSYLLNVYRCAEAIFGAGNCCSGGCSLLWLRPRGVASSQRRLLQS